MPGFPERGSPSRSLLTHNSILRHLACVAVVWALCAAASLPLCAQCGDGLPDPLQPAFDQKNWADVVRLAQGQNALSANDHYDYGMALAHLSRWPQARSELLAGNRACPRDKRFPEELAGVAFEQRKYPEAATWLRRALRLDPKDDYANNFAGTVYYLMGNMPAALQYWNRVSKPQIASLRFDPQLRVRRLLLGRAFAFSPAAILKESQYESTETRLNGLGILPTYNIVLNARPDGSFDAEFHALERDGFGSTPLTALVSTFSGLPYETIYPSYYNIDRSAMNAQSLLRWDKEKRRAWFALGAPLRDLPQNRWTLTADARDENWAVRRSFAGTAPVLGSLNQERQVVTASVTSIRSGRLSWSTGAEFSHRNFREVVDGSALTPQLTQPGWAGAFLASAEAKPLVLPDRRFRIEAGAASETAREWSAPAHLYEKLQGSVLAHWFPQAQSNTWEVQQRVRAGGQLGTAPFDELYMLGVERDNDLWLRGHIGTRDGKKGSSPLGTDYLLANSDVYRRVYSNGLLGVQAGPLLDIGRMAAPTAGLSTSQWLFDTGAEVRLTVLGTNVVLTWGRDLRGGHNAFYGTAQ